MSQPKIWISFGNCKKNEWKNITSEFCSKLVNCWYQRRNDVSQAKGKFADINIVEIHEIFQLKLVYFSTFGRCSLTFAREEIALYSLYSCLFNEYFV